MACPRSRYSGSNGGTAIRSVWSSVRSSLNRARLFLTTSKARSRSRLNSAAPYSTQACPPITRLFTWCARVKERALSIGLRVRPPSDLQVVGPQLLRLGPPLLGCQREPFQPLGLGEPLLIGQQISQCLVFQDLRTFVR